MSETALAETEAKEMEVYRPTKADLFVDAFIRNRFNAQRAALEVFDINMDDEKKGLNTAGVMGWEYLKKPKVQQMLKERMSRADVSVEMVIQNIKQLAISAESEDMRLRALDRLAHFVGAEIKERSTDVSRGRNAHLSLYMGLPYDKNEKKESRTVIDVQ
jgi:hypothetical protein